MIEPADDLDRLPVAALPGAGAQTAARLSKLGLLTAQDLLFHLPLRYEDRTHITPLSQLQGGMRALIEGRIEWVELAPRGRRSLLVRIGDGSGVATLRFFHFNAGQRQQLAPGRLLRCYGEVREGFYGPELAHPEYQLLEPGQAGRVDARLTPVYPTTEGIRQPVLRRLIGTALDQVMAKRLTDWLPSDLLAPVAGLDLGEALQLLHRPPPGHDERSPRLMAARRRLAFEELLAHHLSLCRFRAGLQSHAAPPLHLPVRVKAEFLGRLPFPLTAAQVRVSEEIAADLAGSRPMMRLVQGDVGSGKTVVAALAALTAIASDHQVAVMAPTELLAEQHARHFRYWLEPMGVQVVLLSGRVKGTARREALAAVASGTAGVIIGTHALFQERVAFSRLGLVIIDEQHRFGVHQRLALREKGGNDGVYPHQLIMTATPIPRTLAMLGYADLDLSVIDERPPGRTPVTTVVIPVGRRPEVIARIGEWAARGRQVYWVCTLIEESELLQAEAAEQTAMRLAEALPSLRIGLLHGRRKAEDKEAIMRAFQAGEIDLLVATTVIEVGVDVPNASLMVIENAERLGLAQLHQLRGRVGRGPGEAHCVLLYRPPLSDTAHQRLATLRASDDGFLIAQKDLEIRGPGELLGTRQTGPVQFRVADLIRDAALVEAVHAAAERLWREHPERVEPLIRRWVGAAEHYARA